MKLQFEAGNGINFILGENETIRIYAEVEVPEEASDDYGYLTMKKAILRELYDEEAKAVEFWYDGQEEFLSADADIAAEVTVEIERTERTWYAVLMDDEDDDWGTGSYDYEEAVKMAKRMDATQIAVIADNHDPICTDVITDF